MLLPFATFWLRIDQVCCRCYYQLRQLRLIARSLTFNAANATFEMFSKVKEIMRKYTPRMGSLKSRDGKERIPGRAV